MWFEVLKPHFQKLLPFLGNFTAYANYQEIDNIILW